MTTYEYLNNSAPSQDYLHQWEIFLTDLDELYQPQTKETVENLPVHWVTYEPCLMAA